VPLCLCGEEFRFIGQFLVFLIFPVVVLPYFEEQFEVRLQHVLPPMAGKVLFYRHGAAIESLLEEFNSANSLFVILEENMALARSLRDRGYNVVFGKLSEDPSVLISVKEAQAVVTNADDHANATCTLIVREFANDMACPSSANGMAEFLPRRKGPPRKWSLARFSSSVATPIRKRSSGWRCRSAAPVRLCWPATVRGRPRLERRQRIGICHRRGARLCT
jgi:hypothetical protein